MSVGPHLQKDGIEAPSYEALLEIAVAKLQGRRDWHIVCGPLTTGGTSNQRYNFQIFNAMILSLQCQGVRVFNQMPFERGIRKLMHEDEERGHTGYHRRVITDFYQPLFETRSFEVGDFIHGWWTSTGATEENGILVRLGTKIQVLSRADIRRALESVGYSKEHVADVMLLVPPGPE